MMANRLNRLLNIRPHESPLVFRLLAIQFLLGLGIAFLITGSYSFFLYRYATSYMPWVYVITAVFLFPINGLYNWLDQKMNSFRLLKLVLLFAAGSVALMLLIWQLFPTLPTALMLVGWNIVVYMLVGYGYWGMVSLLFNVRESRRVFSVVGAGDLPAKLIGYITISLTAGLLPLEAIIALSVVFFLLAWLVGNQLLGKGKVNWEEFEHSQHAGHASHQELQWWVRFFGSPLIISIAALSFMAYLVFFTVDFTFLTEIKVRNKSAKELTAFLGAFFGFGRVLAIILKLVFTSRIIARMGLITTLMFTPLLLMVFSLIALATTSIIGSAENTNLYLYLFGIMALFSEVFRSALQEPVFFVLFQPLNIHLRLKGHLIAKGYVLPPALLLVGGFLVYWLSFHQSLPIGTTLVVVFIFLIIWFALVFPIRKHYFGAVNKAIGKGIFSGAALFLNDKATEKALLTKVQGHQPLQVIHALHLLERSEYPDYEALLLEQLRRPIPMLQEFVLNEIIAKRMTGALPVLKELSGAGESKANLDLGLVAKAIFALDEDYEPEYDANNPNNKMKMEKVALENGLMRGKDQARKQLREWSLSTSAEQRSMAAAVIRDAQYEEGAHFVETLVQDTNSAVAGAAMDAAGNLKLQSMVPYLLEKLEDAKLKPIARNALLHFGDDLFELPIVSTQLRPHAQLYQLVALAGKTEGPASCQFLLNALKAKTIREEIIIEVLWNRKDQLASENLPSLEIIFALRLEQCAKKMETAIELSAHAAYQELATAVFSETKGQIAFLLQLAGVIYGKEKLKRLHDISLNASKGQLANALELLDQALPPRYAGKLAQLMEQVMEWNSNSAFMDAKRRKHSLAELIKEILDAKEMYGHWVIGLTYYLMAKNPQPSFLKMVEKHQESDSAPLVQEARKHLDNQLRKN